MSLGVKQQLLTPHEIHDLEPNIKKFIMVEFYIQMQSMQEILKKYY